jgi:hypothetical protein
LDFVIFFSLLFPWVIPILCSRILVSRVNISWLEFFLYFLNWFFLVSHFIIQFDQELTSIVLFNFFYRWLFKSYDRAMNLACWIELFYFILFSLSFIIWFVNNWVSDFFFIFYFIKLSCYFLIFVLLSHKIVMIFLKNLKSIFL